MNCEVVFGWEDPKHNREILIDFMKKDSNVSKSQFKIKID